MSDTKNNTKAPAEEGGNGTKVGIIIVSILLVVALCVCVGAGFYTYKKVPSPKTASLTFKISAIAGLFTAMLAVTDIVLIGKHSKANSNEKKEEESTSETKA